jgi:hypothetical protein
MLIPVVTAYCFIVYESRAQETNVKKRNYPSNPNLLKTYYDKTTLKSKMKRKGCQRKKKYNELTPEKRAIPSIQAKRIAYKRGTLEIK